MNAFRKGLSQLFVQTSPTSKPCSNSDDIVDYCEHVCHKRLNSIVNNSENRLFKLLPTSNNISYDLRKNKRFIIPE